MRRALAIACGAILIAGSLALPAIAGELSVEGTSFVLHDGTQTLRSPQLVGAEIAISGGFQLRIDSVRSDPKDREILLHKFSVKDDASDWHNPCAPDRLGSQEGFPLPGRWSDKAGFYADNKFFAITCTSGAQAKCVRFGYKPWKLAWDGRSLRPVFESCVRMLRADYCGDGESNTRDGTPIAVYDDYRVRRTWIEQDFRFEAGWSPSGAICVHHARLRERSFEEMIRRCPHLATSLGKACTEEMAREGGAILFNLSIAEQ